MDGPTDVSSQDRSGRYLLDGCVSTRNRKVELESLLGLMSCQPASNPPAAKPHIATASIVSLHGNLRAEQD
jgi:hypothetical protein